jgi:histone-lysine N-methyltransferase SETMAR
MEKEEQRFVIKYFWMKNWGAKKIYQELVTTLGADAYSRSQIKIWLQKFKNGDLSCMDLPRPGRPLLTLGPQLDAFLQKYPFASARELAHHFLTSVPTIKEILQRELGMKKFTRRWVPHFLSPAQKVARVEASTEMLRILHEAEENDFDGIATGDESWFRYHYPSSKMFARSPRDVIPRTRQGIGVKKTMITVFFTGRKLIVLDILPKGSRFNQLYFVDYIFPDLERENRNFHRRIPDATFCVHMDNSMCHNGSKVAAKFEKYHVIRSPHPPYSPDTSPCDFWLFGMLKEVLKDREFSSSDEIEEAITKVWDDLTFDQVQSVFHEWIRRLTWVIENGGEYIIE